MARTVATHLAEQVKVLDKPLVKIRLARCLIKSLSWPGWSPKFRENSQSSQLVETHWLRRWCPVLKTSRRWAFLCLKWKGRRWRRRRGTSTWKRLCTPRWHLVKRRGTPGHMWEGVHKLLSCQGLPRTSLSLTSPGTKSLWSRSTSHSPLRPGWSRAFLCSRWPLFMLHVHYFWSWRTGTPGKEVAASSCLGMECISYTIYNNHPLKFNFQGGNKENKD